MSRVDYEFILGLKRALQYHQWNAHNNDIPHSIALALSGGVDSVCLLDLLLRFKAQFRPKLNITAITVDHKIRQESSREANELQKYLTTELLPKRGITEGVSHEILEINEHINEKQLERHARDLRHKLILNKCEQVGASRIFMAHHLDDQLETMVVRLRSHSTLFGVRGMLPQSRYPMSSPLVDLQITRPLLNVTKKEIYQYARENKLQWFEDKTNFDPDLTVRNFYRHYLTQHEDGSRGSTLNKESLLKTYKDVLHVVESWEEKVVLLKQELIERRKFKYSDKHLSLAFELPHDIFLRYTFIEIDRFIFEAVFKISGVASYHYGFTKLNSSDAITTYSSLVHKPKSFIKDILDNKESYLKLPLYKCLFEVRNDLGDADLNNRSLKFDIYRSRKMPVDDEETNITFVTPDSLNKFSDWMFFDNRIFIRMQIKSENFLNKELEISTFDYLKQVSELKRSFAKKEIESIRRTLNKYSLPVIKEKESGEIVCFPTLKCFRTNLKNIPKKVEVKLKPDF